MYFFQSTLRFASIALLLSAFLASAYPLSHERRASGVKLELYEYPPSDSSSQGAPFVTLELGKFPPGNKARGYPVNWKAEGDTVGKPATAIKLRNEEFDRVVKLYTDKGTLLGTGQDEKKDLWAIVLRTDQKSGTSE